MKNKLDVSNIKDKEVAWDGKGNNELRWESNRKESYRSRVLNAKNPWA